MLIADETMVSFTYELRNGAGDILDASKDGEPLSYIHGTSSIIVGLEQRLAGHSSGETLQVEVPPAEAYGEIDQDLFIQVPMEAFADAPAEAFVPGTMFSGPHPKDQSREVQYRIVEVQDDAVFASGNHPLAGETLHFAVSITEVRQATDEELAALNTDCCGDGSCDTQDDSAGDKADGRECCGGGQCQA